LEEKGLIQISILDDPEFKSYYVVQVKEIVPNEEEEQQSYSNHAFYWNLK
jgi:hypothetical protein